MHISSSEFVISNTDYKRCPEGRLHEFAFIGRSNVGKSSLINMLLQHPDLAKTSSKPGKTLLINHFIVNKEWYIVDLPGYGYARASKEQRRKLRGIIEGHFHLSINYHSTFSNSSKHWRNYGLINCGFGKL